VIALKNLSPSDNNHNIRKLTMTTKVLQPDLKHVMIAETHETHVTSLQEIAETICDNAINQAIAKFSPSLRNIGLAELMKRNEFFDYFQYGLANGITNVLAANDERVQAIYYFDPYMNPDAETEEFMPLDVSVNLLVLVQSKTAALTSFIAALDRALTQRVVELPSSAVAALSSILNALLITEADVTNRKGYAALISSMFAKPRQIWSR
jgi:hypothetical protein